MILSSYDVPPLAFRFCASFYIPSPVDINFQKVSGIGATVDTYSVENGGQNYYAQQLPKGITHENLVLERGFTVNSKIGRAFDDAMEAFTLKAGDVLISLLDADETALASWLFINAYPVKWKLSDLDADSNTVVIETMELSYQNMLTIRL